MGVCTFAPVSSSALTSGDFEYEVLSNNTAKITKYTGSNTNLDIPSELNRYTVTSIGNYAFKTCSSLESITIPNSVTTIESSAFYKWTSLTSIAIPDSVTTIGLCAFQDCTALTNIDIPDSVTLITYSAFRDCSSLDSITILNPECHIDDSSSTIPTTATIYGYNNSTAQTYAREHSIDFISLGDPPNVPSTEGTTSELQTLPLDDETAPVEPETALYYKIGDVDLDGDVTIIDATLIQHSLARLTTLSYTQTLAADTDRDSSVTIIDATYIQYFLAKIIPTL